MTRVSWIQLWLPLLNRRSEWPVVPPPRAPSAGAACCIRAGVRNGPVFSIRLASRLKLPQKMSAVGGWTGRAAPLLYFLKIFTPAIWSGAVCASAEPSPIPLSNGQFGGVGHANVDCPLLSTYV